MVKPSYGRVVARAGIDARRLVGRAQQRHAVADDDRDRRHGEGAVSPQRVGGEPGQPADRERVGRHEDVGCGGLERAFGVGVHAASMVTVRVVSSVSPAATWRASPTGGRGRQRALRDPRLDAERVGAGERHRLRTAVRLPRDEPAEHRRIPVQPRARGRAPGSSRAACRRKVGQVHVVVAVRARARAVAAGRRCRRCAAARRARRCAGPARGAPCPRTSPGS